MKLKYVGAKPIVSQYGVSFDQKEQDPYTLLESVVELLEVLSKKELNGKTIDITSLISQQHSSSQIVEILEKFCGDFEEVFAIRESKTEEMIQEYTDAVKNNSKLTKTERGAWLGNINLMRDYYLQFITNKYAYKSALNALIDMIFQRNIGEIVFELGRNYGLILSHLQPLLLDHSLSLDASMVFDEEDGKPIGRFIIENHS